MTEHNVQWTSAVKVDGREVVSMARDTLSEAIADLVTSAVYYKAIYPDAKVDIDDFNAVCGRCWNTGKVGLKRRKGLIRGRCPNCRGKGESGIVPGFTFTMPSSANRIALTQGD